MKHHDVIRFRHKPCERSPRELAGRALERASVTVRIGRHECHLVLAEAGFHRDPHQRGLACFIDRTIRRHDLHEDQQRLSRSEIHQDEIGQIAAGVDRETFCLNRLRGSAALQGVHAAWRAGRAVPAAIPALGDAHFGGLRMRRSKNEQEGEGAVASVGAIAARARRDST